MQPDCRRMTEPVAYQGFDEVSPRTKLDGAGRRLEKCEQNQQRLLISRNAPADVKFENKMMGCYQPSVSILFDTCPGIKEQVHDLNTQKVTQ